MNIFIGGLGIITPTYVVRVVGVSLLVGKSYSYVSGYINYVHITLNKTSSHDPFQTLTSQGFPLQYQHC